MHEGERRRERECGEDGVRALLASLASGGRDCTGVRQWCNSHPHPPPRSPEHWGGGGLVRVSPSSSRLTTRRRSPPPMTHTEPAVSAVVAGDILIRETPADDSLVRMLQSPAEARKVFFVFFFSHHGSRLTPGATRQMPLISRPARKSETATHHVGGHLVQKISIFKLLSRPASPLCAFLSFSVGWGGAG